MPDEFKPGNTWGKIDFFVKLIAVVLSIIGGGIAFQMYLAGQQALNDQRSYAIIAIYDQPFTQKAVAALNRNIETLMFDLGDDSNKNHVGYVIHDGYVRYSSAEKRAEFSRIWYLISRISHCHAHGYCDRIILEDYFCGFVKTYWEVFRYTMAISETAKKIAFVDKFVQACSRA